MCPLTSEDRNKSKAPQKDQNNFYAGKRRAFLIKWDLLFLSSIKQIMSPNRPFQQHTIPKVHLLFKKSFFFFVFYSFQDFNNGWNQYLFKTSDQIVVGFSARQAVSGLRASQEGCGRLEKGESAWAHPSFCVSAIHRQSHLGKEKKALLQAIPTNG